MADFCGEWELVSSDDNFDNYMKVVGVAEEKRQVALTALHNGAKLRQAISRDGDTWTVRIITAQGERSFVYTEGTPVDVTTLDGRTVSVVYSLEGGELVETQTGQGFVSRNVRTVAGDTLTFTMTVASDGVSCVRTYKKV